MGFSGFTKRGGNLMYLGGLWRSRGRAANYLFGIGPCAFGTGLGKAYVPDYKLAVDPLYSWIFDGIGPNMLIGGNGFSGGASGDEIDRVDFKLGSPTGTIMLATSQRHDDTFELFNEDSMFPLVNTLGSQCDRVRSDIIFNETVGGGGIFSVGSINCYSSLSWDGFSNNVAKMTDNVLRGFVKQGKGRAQSHPVYCVLTLLTPGRATLKQRSPITHPGDTRLFSAFKPHAGQLVVWWVTTCES
ncbi:hypothetical protein N7495_009536 [Penicillium taxi]|uniref:uncharacterized protein n=1 Tax=Penicillium taxi TaxID=168475 RepID=UPI0025455734|nr:uncharacterized protein N7495_009536 [Penicillium taxi]KAJ5885026.1 hypothetical protein N7495_009536 [Penicillium taxi]